MVSALMQSIQGGMKLQPTKTVDRSTPISGKVFGKVILKYALLILLVRTLADIDDRGHSMWRWV